MWTEKDREKYKDDGRRYPSDLTDVEWSIIEPLFRGYFTFTADMREVVNACFYLEHTGCPWRALPSDFGPHQTVRTWYDRFRADGVWAQAGADLTRRSPRSWGGADDWDPGLAKCCFRAAAGGARGRRQQENQGHQAPCSELLAGVRPGRRRHARQ